MLKRKYYPVCFTSDKYKHLRQIPTGNINSIHFQMILQIELMTQLEERCRKEFMKNGEPVLDFLAGNMWSSINALAVPA